MLVLDETKPTVLPEFNYTNCYVHLAEAGFNRSLPAEGGGTTQGVTEESACTKDLDVLLTYKKREPEAELSFRFL